MNYNQLPTTVIHSPEASAEMCAAAALVVTAGARTTGEIAEAIGCGRTTAFHAMRALRDAGVVDFEDTKRGTLHSLVRRVR